MVSEKYRQDYREGVPPEQDQNHNFSDYSLELVFLVKLTISTVPRPFHGCNIHSALPFCFFLSKVVH